MPRKAAKMETFCQGYRLAREGAYAVLGVGL